LVERLRDRGWRLTAQRRVVAEVLAGEHVHLTADAVYNTLNELVDMGEVLEISTGDGAKRYDPNTTAAHHHLHCIQCGTLRDVNPAGTDLVVLPASEHHGFEVLDMDIVFRGRCPACRAADSP
jgi:Fe2+ or Zn2+ uptake regulation protein